MKPSRRESKEGPQPPPVASKKKQQQQQQRRQGQPTPPPPSVDRGANVQAMKQFAELVSLDVDLESARSLDMRNKGLRALPGNLGAMLRNIRKLDLAGNGIADLAPLSSIPLLSNLNISQNTGVTSLATLQCSKLVVLSVASCGLTTLKGVECCAPSLRTLIANDNAIQLQAPEDQRVDPMLPAQVRAVATLSVAVGNYLALASLTSCETVVLTRNPALAALYPAVDDVESGDRGKHKATKESEQEEKEEEEQGEEAKEERQYLAKVLAAAHPLSAFEKLTQLKKLSLSDCGLTSLPARWFLPMVTELRLARNALNSLHPDGVIIRSLKTLDVSHNELTSIATLRRCHYVQRLNIHGNPFLDIYTARDREEEQNMAVREGRASREKDQKKAEEETKSPQVPVSLQRSLKRMLPQLEAIDGQPLLAESELAFRRRPRDSSSKAETATGSNGEDAEEVDDAHREGSAPTPPRARKAERKEAKVKTRRTRGTGEDDADSPAAVVVVEHHGAPRRGKPRRDAATLAKVLADAEERDVVVEAPEAVVRETHAPIIRRERNTPMPRKGVALAGEAAVAKLLKQRRETQGW